MTRILPSALVVFLVLSLGLTPPASAGHAYEQALWFQWGKTDLDVLVVGVHDPLIGAAIRDAITSWEVGIAELAPDWLAGSLELRVYFPGSDPVPPAGFQFDNIDIYVIPQGAMAIYSPPRQVCVATAPFLASWTTMYHVALHEFGHCLGLSHVHEHDVEYSPRFDPMGGGESGFRSCPSNLNMIVLEQVFGTDPVQGGTRSTIMAADYRQASC